jgi:TonB family protein
MDMLCLGASFLLALIQASTAVQPADVTTPADANERIALARKVNGLEGTDILPWHLKASYEVFDTEGKSKDKGTYEEWRITPKQYRLAFQSPLVSFEEYRTDQAVFRSGGQDWPGRPLGMIQEAIVEPIPVTVNMDKTMFTNYERSFGKVKAPCTALVDRHRTQPPENAMSYCFAPTNAVLLYSTSSGKVYQALYQHISAVHGHYLAHDIQYFLLGKPWLTIHIDTLESISLSALPSLTVPAGLLPVERRENGAPGVVKVGALTSKVVPVYPVAAKLMGVQGTVLLGATIARDGHIRKLEVLAGPPQLQQPALDAVKQWVYAPYLLDGEPVEVQTDINVVFSLGR